MTPFRSLASAALLGISALALTATSANAAPCRNAKGQFTKCAASASVITPRKTVAMRSAVATTAKPKAVRTASLARTATKATPKSAHKTAG